LRRPWIAAAFVIAWPTLWLMSCFALTESLSIALAAAVTYFAIRLWREPRLVFVVAAGAVAGFAQLVRFDMICLAPTVLVAIFYATRDTRRRLQLAAAYATVALVVFAPWPIRNLVRFGRPYVAATQWRMATGKPLLDGPVQWARTWADSAIGDSYWELYFVYGAPIQIERPGIIQPKLYDSDAERERLIGIYRDFNRYGLDDKVDGEFRALAADRARAHPLRTFVKLPLLRVAHLFWPEPAYEMPMQVPWLGLPPLRFLFGIVDGVVCLLALAAFFVARRSPLRPVLLLLAVQVVARFAVFAFAIPQATTQRYLVEAFPALLVLACITVASLRRDRATAR
jgi:hypothetical protein